MLFRGAVCDTDKDTGLCCATTAAPGWLPACLVVGDLLCLCVQSGGSLMGSKRTCPSEPTYGVL